MFLDKKWKLKYENFNKNCFSSHNKQEYFYNNISQIIKKKNFNLKRFKILIYWLLIIKFVFKKYVIFLNFLFSSSKFSQFKSITFNLSLFKL